MNILIQMKLNKILPILLLSVTQLLAQDIGITEVRVVEGFKPTVPQAIRLNEKAIFTDTLKKDRSQEYIVVTTDLQSDYKTRPLKAAKIKANKIPQLYGSKVAIGFGNARTTNASVVHNSMRSKMLSYGVLLNHFSNEYKAPSLVRNSKSTMRIYAKKISTTHILTGNLDYDRRTSLYSFLDDRNYRNRFAYTKFSLSAISKELKEDKLKHHTTFFVSDFNELSENQIHLSTNLTKTINDFPFSLEIGFDDYLNYNNSDSKFKNRNMQLLQFSSSTSITRYRFDFDLGLDVDYAFDGTLGISPQIKATKELVKDILLVYGGLRHSEQLHTLKSLSDENPYIHSYGTNQTILSDNNLLQDLRITEVDEVYLAMRNVLGRGEVLEGSISYGSVGDMNHFIQLDTFSYNRFLVDYINVKQLHVDINYDREINNIISVNLDASFYKWDDAVYYKPNFRCEFTAPINLRNKIKVKPTLSYIGKRLYDVDKELSAQLYTNLGLYYNYTQNIGAYFQLNNLTNSKQELWEDYREGGFNGLFGLYYSF